jgi:hypothetical protein
MKRCGHGDKGRRGAIAGATRPVGRPGDAAPEFFSGSYEQPPRRTGRLVLRSATAVKGVRALLGLVCLFFAGAVWAQTTRTWNGSVSADWFNPTNWAPVGVPASNDTVNFSAGTINLTSPVPFAGQFNWFGGTLSGNGLTILSNGVLNISANGNTVALGNTLTNQGTVNWTGGNIQLYVCGYGNAVGPVVNQAGAQWNIQCDQTLYVSCGGDTNAYFLNAGTVQKTASTGTTYFSLPVYNGGAFSVTNGTLNFNAGGVLGGSYSAASGATVNFSAGAFSYTTVPVLSGPGTFLFSGGTLTLISNLIPNMQMTGGTLTLGTNFQGGTITNLTFGGVLSGSYTVSGTFNCSGGVSGTLTVVSGGTLNWSGGNIGALVVNSGGTLNWSGGTLLSGFSVVPGAFINWSGGLVSGPVSVPTNGVLTIDANGNTVALGNTLTNQGTVNWTGGNIQLYVCGYGNAVGPVVNQAGGFWNIQCDQSLYVSCGGDTNAFFLNAGTVQKTANTGTTYFSLPFYNAGTLNMLEGSINFNVANSYAQTGATLDFGIAGPGLPTPMVVNGNLSLDGGLGAAFLNSYKPKTGDTLPLISCGALTNSFGALNLPPAGTNLGWRVAYAANGVSLVVVSNGTVTAQITGSVTDNTSAPVTNINVFAFTTNSSNSIFLSTFTDNSGNYVLNVSNGVWRVGVQGLVPRGYNNVPTQDVVVNNANQVVNFVAQPYTGPTYTITVTASPLSGGTAAGGGVFLPGSLVTLTATANTNALPYFFNGWTENGVPQSSSSAYAFLAERSRNLVANFALPSFTVSASNNPPAGGTVSGTGTYSYGSTSVLTAQPNFGYNFGSWTQNGAIVGTTPSLTNVVYSNLNFVANYTEANTNHFVTTVTQPPGLAVVTGAGTYTNGQSGTFTAPPVVVSGQYDYFFQKFVLTNIAVSTSTSFTKVFSTVDPTNLQYTAVYAVLSTNPVVTNVTVNLPNPVPATTNFQLTFRFDRTMNTNVTPQVLLTNSASGAVQPVVPPGGSWASAVVNNDTFYPPAITFVHGMDGTIQVFVSGAQDPLGGTVLRTNVYTVSLDATPPVLSNIAASPAVLSAFVTWNSDKPSSSLVEYSTSPAYGLSSGLYGQLVTTHGITLYNLNPITSYHYRVRSRDLAGNETISGDNTFTTFAAPDLQVTNLVVTGNLTSGGNLLISWTDTNSGSGATFTSWYDQVMVTNSTTGQTLLNSSVLYDPSLNGNLAAGGLQNRQISFRLPDGTAGSGNLQVIVTVNVFGNQYEVNANNNTEAIGLSSVLAAYPDLQITGLAVTNSQILSGNSVGIVWSDANNGNGSVSNSFYDQVVVVNQTTAQTLLNTTLTDTAATTPIGPSQSVGRQLSFVLPDGTAGAGTLQITITADIYDNVFEYNTNGTAKSNNTNSTTVVSTLAPYPDLAVTNVVVPATANAGQSISVAWTETNQGLAPATNTWYDQVFLTGTNLIGGGQLLGSFAFTNGLAVAQSTNITQTVTLPRFVQGNQWLVVKANALTSFYELNTSNNASISTQAVAVTPTLLLNLSQAKVSESAGTNSMSATLTRNGNISGPLTVQLATDTMKYLYVPDSVTIAAGQSAVNFLLGPIDNFIAASPVLETVTATANGFPPATAPVTILQDDPTTLALSLSAATVNDNAGANSVQGTVTRNANFGTALTVTLLSDNRGALTVPANVTIPSGQDSATFGLTPVSTTLLGGAKKVTVSAAAPGFSSVSTPISVLNVNFLPLTLTLQNSTVSKGAGNSADFGTVTIPAALPAAQNILLSVSNSSLVTCPTVVTIVGGATSVSFPVSVGNDGLVTGTQTATLLAQALTPDQIALTNGQSTTQLQILDVNGATLSLHLSNSTIYKGSNTLATLTRNTPPTNAVTVTLASSPSGIVSLPANAVLPLNQTSTTFTVTAILDSHQTGAEQVSLTASAPGFNPGATPLTVADIYVPDLVPTAINFPTNGLTSSQFTVNWVVANNGLGPATNQTWYDYVYLATGTVGQNEVLVAAVTNASGLPVGASYTNQASFYMPAVPGNYWIVVVTDGGNVVTELNKQNNTLISSLPTSANPVYRAALTNVTPNVAAQGTPIVLSGWTYNPTNNQPVPNTAALVSIQVNGTTRNFPVVSDANARFSYTFQPLANEAGDYTAGADYPELSPIGPQVSFVLLGMQALPGNLNVQLLPATPLTGQLVLSNITDQPLSGLAVTVPNLQGNLTAQFAFTNTTLPPFGAMTVNVTLQSPLTHSAQIKFSTIVTSTQGAQLLIPVTANVVPLVPQLIANPSYINSGMVVGQQTTLSFDILNTGGASSGDLTVQLPTNLTWMTLASPGTIPSIPAGGKATVMLLLTPPPSLTLTLYTGNLAASSGISGLSVPFQIRAVSESTGELRVTATDDNTYYVAGAPKVTNATVIVRDPFTSVIIAQTNSDANGIADFPGLPAGPYTVEATAPERNQFRGSASVAPGVSTALEAFMPNELVTYQWTVTPTQIRDQYQIVLQSVFQTQVPVPNVVVAEPQVLVPVVPGEASQFVITLSNEGLIEAENVSIQVPDDPIYLVTPLVTNVGIIPAQSSVQIPVTVQLISAPAPGLVRGAHPHPDLPGCGAVNTFSGCFPDIPLTVTYSFVCGNNLDQESRTIDLKAMCTENQVVACLKSFLSTAKSENIYALGCNAITEFLTCAGISLSPCQSAAISTTCGALTGGLVGAIGGGGSDLIQCACSLLKNISLPSGPPAPPPPPSPGCLICGFGGGGGGWTANGGGWSTSIGVAGSDCSAGSSQIRPATTGLAVPFPKLKLPHKLDSTQGVCATVRIRIAQDVVMSRSAFTGTLDIDDGGSTALTGVRVNLTFQNATNGDATSDFVIEGPTLTTLTAVDGTGVLPGGATGSAVYTFIPTDDAAPNAPATYQIGGTLSYMDNGQQVTVPLLSAPITVYPEAKLNLLYFQQRDVYGPDPLDPALNEPSQPFDLGLLVKNIGAGVAHSFQITSAQPQIVDNEKGLLINFTIIGTEVGDQPVSPSLTARLGDISPGATKEVTWGMLSTLAGKFISFNATFQHVDDMGHTNTSLINSVEIHSLTHQVLANRLTDDDVPDFLVNDIPNPESLPDTLYLSDGTVAAVNVVTSGTFDGPAAPGHLQVQLTTSVSNGWNYIQLPDPGVGYLLTKVVRSDGEVLPMTNDAWTTSLSFPSSSTAPLPENLVHLFDWAGTGAYTLYYHSTNTTPPAIVSLGPVAPFTQPGAVSAVDIVFSELVKTNTFSFTNLNLSFNGGPNLITSGVGLTLTLVSNTTYSINGLAPFSAADGNYQLTVNGFGIYDLWDNNAGNTSATTQWAKGNVAPVVQSISAISPNPRNTPVTSVTVTFSKAINAATFDYHALTFSLNGGPNLITSAVTVTPQSSSSFTISGLGSLTGAQGNYVLTVNATGVQDTGGLAGFGSQTASWSMITTGPMITALEAIATNPRNIVVQTLTVSFSEPIDPATFDYTDITLTRDGGANLVTSAVQVDQVNPTTFVITNISWVQGYAGTYSLTVNAAGVSDLAGNPGTGNTNESWQMILEIPATPTNLAIFPDLGISSHDGLTSTNNLTLSGTVGASNLTVRVYDATTRADLGTATVVGTNFSINLSFTVEGAHQLQVNAIDVAANASLASFFNLFLDVIPPTAIIQQVANPIYSAVSTIPVTFSKPINTNTLSPTNFVVTLNGTNSFTPTLTPVTSSQFTLGNLASFTAQPGAYQVTLYLNGIQDYAGNVNTNAVTMTWTRAVVLPPTITQVSNTNVAPGTPLDIKIAASDPNGFSLAYSLAPGAPAGASIRATNGLFAWTPSCAQGSTTNAITVWATASANPPISNSMTFTITVGDCLQVALGSAIVQAGQSTCLPVNMISTAPLTNLSFTLAYPSNRFNNWTLALTNPPLGTPTVQTLDPSHSAFNLATGSGQTLQGLNLSGQICLTALPGFPAMVPLAVASVAGTKSDGTTVTNGFSQAGRVIVTGPQPLLQAWLATNRSRMLTLYGVPGSNYTVEWNPKLSSAGWQLTWNVTLTNLSQTFQVTNPAPVQFYRAYSSTVVPFITQQGDVSVSAGATLVITNTVVGLPARAVTFTLDPSAPTGASITANGLFVWTPTCAQGSTTNRITVWATHDISPPASNSMSFNVFVGDCVQVGLGGASLQTGQEACVPVNLFSTVGLTNLVFTISYPSNRLGNLTINPTNAAVAAASVQNLDPGHVQIRVGAKTNLVLQGPFSIGTICFDALPGTSGLFQIQALSVDASRGDGTTIGNASGQSVRLVIIGAQPLLEASLGTNFARLLTLYGNPGSSYEIDYATNLSKPKWQYSWRVPMTNFSKMFAANAVLPQVFYRAFEFSANPPMLELNSFVPSNLVLLVYGQKGSNYAIISSTNLSGTINWSSVAGFTLTNSFQFINVGPATNRMQFFRAKDQ